MRSIQVDDEVYGFLLKNINEFGESPNQVLRRLLGITVSLNDKNQDIEHNDDAIKQAKTRGPRVKLSLLVRNGNLEEGQPLYLYSQDLRKMLCMARVAGDYLIWKNKKYSMSSLALQMFKTDGHDIKAIRGPAYWFVGEEEDDPSVADLWATYLEKRASLSFF